MGIRTFIESTPLGQWSSPVQVTICDVRLGLLYWVLAIISVIIGVVTVTGPDGYYKQETAAIDGSKLVSIWFEGSDDMKNLSKSDALYCRPETMFYYDYYYYAGNETYDARFYADKNNRCRRYMIGEVATKPGDGGAFITTFMKETHSVEDTCANVPTCNADFPAVALTPNVEETDDSCKCVTMQNYFVLGAEKVKVAFTHMFEIGPEEVFGDGAGTASSETGQRHVIHTTFKKDGEVYHRKSDGKEMVFEAGDEVGPVLSLEDYLDLAGLWEGLETRNNDVLPSARPVWDARPTLRSTGAIISVNLDYQARIGEDENVEEGHVDCTVTADVTYGWNNMGYLVSYVTQRTLDEDSITEELYNRYRRGVSIKFKAVGVIEKWDAFYAFSVAVDLVVVITMVLPLIVYGIATMLLLDFSGKIDRTSMTIYKHVLNTKFNKTEAKAKIAAHSLIAAVVFKAADTDQNLFMTDEEVVKVFESCGVDTEMARALAIRLVGTDGKIDFMALANLVSSDEASVEEVVENTIKQGTLVDENEHHETPPHSRDKGMIVAHVTVPPGVVPGQKITATVPDGRQVQVQVPPNAKAGSQLQVELPKRGSSIDRTPLSQTL